MNHNYGGYYYEYSQMQHLPHNNRCENGSPPGSNERSSQNRWTNPQTDKLVKFWRDNIVLIESSISYETWLKIRAETNKLDKEKMVLQCRNKIRNLKDIDQNGKKIMRKQDVLLLFHITSMVFTRFLVAELLRICRR